MAEQKTVPQRQPQEPKTLIGKTWASLWKIIGLLLLSLLLSLLIEYIGIVFWWPEEGWQHSKDMLENELGWIDSDFKHSLIISTPGATIGVVLETVFNWIFVKSGLMHLSQNAPKLAAGSGISSIAASGYLIAESFIMATVFTTMTFLVRLSILVLSIPLFILAIITGLVDGLMRRDIRKFGAGRESSFIYHRAKMLIVPLLVAPWVIYLASPIAIPPQFILIPCAISLGIAVVVTVATFKKYL